MSDLPPIIWIVNRGKAAIEHTGILPDYESTVVHDRFASYFSYA
ncbi:MAG: hypothetical protein AAF600_14455 [Bacteroidota bacterium]